MGDYNTLVYAGGREDNNLTLHQLVDRLVVKGDGLDMAGLGLQAWRWSEVDDPVPMQIPGGGDAGKVVELTADGVDVHRPVGAGVWPRGYGQLDPAVEG